MDRKKKFNVTGVCIPAKHYMVDISEKLERVVHEYIEEGKYFVIHRARQYGKTTMLYLLGQRLSGQYLVLDLSFEAADDLFVSQYTLAAGLVRRIYRELKRQNVNGRVLDVWKVPVAEQFPFEDLSERITELCGTFKNRLVLMIDEVDKSSDNQIFLSFLGLLRNKYLEQQKNRDDTFYSVILAGVYDVKNLKMKLRQDGERKYNSPWNIAADFSIDLGFSAAEIATMLYAYEADYKTGMDVEEIACLLYDYTEGYPYLVSRICLLADERVAGSSEYPEKSGVWTKDGILAAIRLLLKEKNTLFDSLMGKLHDDPELKDMIYRLLFQGQDIFYSADHPAIDMVLTFGFAKVKGEVLVIANRIFETRLYNYFLTLPKVQMTEVYQAGGELKNQFFQNGRLNMRLVLEKFVAYFDEIYGERSERFLEEEGRRYFLLYLKPIINGTANYYIEAETRGRERTDIIIDCKGEQFVIELKIWRGNAYKERGEQQLLDYLSYYHVDKGYMLSFNFNKKKRVGVQEIRMGGKVLIEGVV